MNISDKISRKNSKLILALCKPFKVLKEKYKLEIESKTMSNTYLTQEEYERFCKIYILPYATFIPVSITSCTKGVSTLS